jgi:hypothetical protein
LQSAWRAREQSISAVQIRRQRVNVPECLQQGAGSRNDNVSAAHGRDAFLDRVAGNLSKKMVVVPMP